MYKNTYMIDLEDLYRKWKSNHLNLFNFLHMEKVLESLLEEEARIKRIDESILTYAGLDVINEIFMKDLVKKADVARKKRAKSKNIVVSYKGVAKTKGWITFRTTSQYTKGKHYFQYVKLLDTKDLKYLKDLKKKDIMRLLLAGNVACYCSCPDFLFRGFKYMGTQRGYGIFKENRFPRIRNPRQEGTVCKHLLAVFEVFMMNWLRISKDMLNSHYFKSRYEKDK